MYAMERWYNIIGISLVYSLKQYCIIIVVEQIDCTYSGGTNYTQHTTSPPQLLIAKIGKVI
jgi:hypothetical protein